MKCPLFHSLSLLLVGLLLGCDSGRDGVVEIDFWAMGAEGEVVQALIADFEHAHPGIRVKVQPIPWTSAHEEVVNGLCR